MKPAPTAAISMSGPLHESVTLTSAFSRMSAFVTSSRATPEPPGTRGIVAHDDPPRGAVHRQDVLGAELHVGVQTEQRVGG